MANKLEGLVIDLLACQVEASCVEPLVAVITRNHAIALGLPADTVQFAGVHDRHLLQLVVSQHNIL